MAFDIHISDDFKLGKTNNRKFIDLPFLNPAQIELLLNFVEDVANNKALVGKNKPSWLSDNLNQIPDTEAYREYHFWHYHCGEFDPNAKIRSLTYQLKLNLDGLTSAAVIHYRKLTENKIVVVGFSPIHIPFPKENDPENPLFVDED